MVTVSWWSQRPPAPGCGSLSELLLSPPTRAVTRERWLAFGCEKTFWASLTHFLSLSWSEPFLLVPFGGKWHLVTPGDSLQVADSRPWYWAGQGPHLLRQFALPPGTARSFTRRSEGRSSVSRGCVPHLTLSFPREEPGHEYHRWELRVPRAPYPEARDVTGPHSARYREFFGKSVYFCSD